MRRWALFAACLFVCGCPQDPPADPPDAEADACAPAACAAKACGKLDDGCGGQIDCGTCQLPETCGGGGQPGFCGRPPCTPETDRELCQAAGRNCDPLATTDRCGVERSVDCGTCSSPKTCGGSGIDGACGDGTCNESDADLCARFGKNCGTFAQQDVCGEGRTVECGACAAPDECGGGGAENVCGHCTQVETDAQICARLQVACGAVDATDVCGTARRVDCGTCPDAVCESCPDGCTAESSRDICTREQKECGAVTATDNCGTVRTVDCGFCAAPKACGADNRCACTPQDCADLGRTCGTVPDGCGGEMDCGTCASPPPYCLRIAAANLTSGNKQSYDPGEGIRIFQGLKPDIVAMNEFNYGAKTDADIRAMVVAAFGPGFWHYREPGDQIPNGVVSRFPIKSSGTWEDSLAPNRDFAWAQIDVPGPKDLWVVSVHFLTGSAGDRASEAASVVTRVKATVPAGDFVVVGGDFNTDRRTETCLSNLAQIVSTTSPWPLDQKGNGNTNSARDSPYDWVLANSALRALETPLRIGANSFPSGLVFDSRIYTPLADVAPVLKTDSNASYPDKTATNMQHMLVARDFCLPLQ